MRMRKKKNGFSRLVSCGYLWETEPEKNKGSWNKVFGNNNPIHIEIGCGKGSFITQMAKNNPDINYIAVEKLIDVLILAAEKAKTQDLQNIRYILGDAALIEEIINCSEAQRIYINFCDPWHKKRHEKRRLTHKTFLNIYKNILDGNGWIYFKTDNKNLFEYSLNSFCENGFRMKNITLDLHNSGYEGNIMTEYEKLFSELGNPIYRLEAQPSQELSSLYCSCLAK